MTQQRTKVSNLIAAITCIFGVLVLEASSSSDIYTWIDEDGVVHYEDTRPADGESNQVEVALENSRRDRRPASSYSAAPVLSNRRDLESTIEDRQEQSVNSASQIERCDDAKEQLYVLQVGWATYRDDKGRFHSSAKWIHDLYEGEREYLDDAARAREIGIASRQVRGSCGGLAGVDSELGAEEKWLKNQNCKNAKADFALLSAPASRAPPQELSDVRAEVRKFCSK